MSATKTKASLTDNCYTMSGAKVNFFGDCHKTIRKTNNMVTATHEESARVGPEC